MDFDFVKSLIIWMGGLIIVSIIIGLVVDYFLGP